LEYQVRHTRGDVHTTDSEITGYAAVFYDGTPETEYRLMEGYTERIAPTAFDRALDHNIFCLWDHDKGTYLGCTDSGTLKLSIDGRGLKYTLNYDPSDPDHQRVRAKIARGDCTGASFRFGILEDEWIRGKSPVNVVKQLYLVEVGPTPWACYKGSSCSIRSARDMDDVKTRYLQWETQQRLAHLEDLAI